MSVYENDRKLFHTFKVLLHNRGISLWNVTVAIRFLLEDGGSMSFQLSPHIDEDSPGPPPITPTTPVEFARGMLAEYSIKSYKLVLPGSVECLTRLKDARKQVAKICVFSQGYLAYSIRVGGVADRAKARWNQIAYRVNRRFEKRIDRPDGPCPALKCPQVLPTFLVLEDHLMYFIRELSRRT